MKMAKGKIFLFLGAVALSGGLIVSTCIATRGLVTIKTRDQDTIVVTGSAKRQIRSDSILWYATVESRASTIASAYQELSKQIPIVTQYLTNKGIPSSEIKVSAVSTHTINGRNKDGEVMREVIIGYEMNQTVQIQSKNVDKVAQVAREVTELINQGVQISSENPQYIYTKLGELKITMLEEAAKDARLRAEKMATSTGAKIGKLRSARMGVIQVNPVGSSEVSDTGVNDTSSLEKDITTVVSAMFALE